MIFCTSNLHQKTLGNIINENTGSPFLIDSTTFSAAHPGPSRVSFQSYSKLFGRNPLKSFQSSRNSSSGLLLEELVLVAASASAKKFDIPVHRPLYWAECTVVVPSVQDLQPFFPHSARNSESFTEPVRSGRILLIAFRSSIQSCLIFLSPASTSGVRSRMSASISGRFLPRFCSMNTM